MTKYFILDKKRNPKEVSKNEHLTWIGKNTTKFNREFNRDNGSKQISLTFKGMQEPNKELVLFSVRSVFRGFDFSIVTDFEHGFSSFKDATEHYEEELALNGDAE